ncbi:MAG: carboxypeptidase regulatory-like domain-containing protein, partial [Acidobacteria bacterium]|nr:carboxypeptidase regulatory-like domain-containing protein [Acidobacteriota bacterium]
EVRGRVRDSLHNQDLEGNGYLKLGIKFKKSTAKVIKLECDQHNHMQNWFYRIENPYYAFSGPDGTFKIDQIPPGTYKLIAWHPILGEQEQEITITANGTSDVTFAFSSGRRRPRT